MKDETILRISYYKPRYFKGTVRKITYEEEEGPSQNARYRKVVQDIRKKDLFSNVLLILSGRTESM